MHIIRTQIQQQAHIGLYGYCTNKYVILGKKPQEYPSKQISKVLGLPIIEMNLCGTSLVGVFLAGNDKRLLVPKIILEHEEKNLKKNEIDYAIIDTDHTALGNNIVCNDKAGLISPELENVKEEIKKALGLEKIETFSIQQMPTIGSMMVLNSKGVLISGIASNEETEYVEKFFGLPVIKTTVNLGNIYIGAGMIANNNGVIVGNQTTGVEAQRIEEGLGFLKF